MCLTACTGTLEVGHTGSRKFYPLDEAMCLTCGTLEGVSLLPATEMVNSVSLVCRGDSARKPRPCLAGSSRHPIWCEANGGRATPMSRQQVGRLALLEGATMNMQLQTLLRACEA